MNCFLTYDWIKVCILYFPFSWKTFDFSGHSHLQLCIKDFAKFFSINWQIDYNCLFEDFWQLLSFKSFSFVCKSTFTPGKIKKKLQSIYAQIIIFLINGTNLGRFSVKIMIRFSLISLSYLFKLGWQIVLLSSYFCCWVWLWRGQIIPLQLALAEKYRRIGVQLLIYIFICCGVEVDNRAKHLKLFQNKIAFSSCMNQNYKHLHSIFPVILHGKNDILPIFSITLHFKNRPV